MCLKKGEANEMGLAIMPEYHSATRRDNNERQKVQNVEIIDNQLLLGSFQVLKSDMEAIQ